MTPGSMYCSDASAALRLLSDEAMRM